jgi:hypothetical protein
MVGPTFGRYRLSARVTHEEAGELWRGVEIGVGGVERPVAVRLMSPGSATGAEAVRRAFVLCHQNVVQLRDVGESDGRLFVVMEWVDGADLGAILARLRAQAGQPLPLRYACLVGVEAARGLDYAHRARDAGGRPLGLVHGTVSPACLMVSFEGEIKVAGFGLGRGEAAGDPRADVFALGAVLYETVSGQAPPAGRAPTLRTLVPTVPQGLEAIVLRAMAPAREQRYETCAHMREDLEAFARRESYALSPSDFGQFVRDLMQAPAPRVPTATEPERTPSGVRRLSGSRAVASPRAFGAALGGALAALGGDAEEAAAAGEASAAERPRAATVAVEVQAHRAIAPPPDFEPQVPTDMTELIPRQRRAPLWIGAAAAAIALVGGVAWYAHGHAPAATALVAPAALAPAAPAALAPAAPAPAAPSPVATSPAAASPAPFAPTPSPAAIGRVVAAPPRDHRRAHAASPRVADAHLTITSDVAAEAFVDGELVRATPIVDLAVAPGRHVVRVESTAAGLRLIPRQETVELRPGELRQLQMDLK